MSIPARSHAAPKPVPVPSSRSRPPGIDAAKAAKSAGLNLSPKKQAFFVQGQNRAGAAADVLRKLADAKVNVRGANGSAGQGGFGMIVWVAPSDYAAAAKALGV